MSDRADVSDVSDGVGQGRTGSDGRTLRVLFVGGKMMADGPGGASAMCEGISF